MFSGNKNKKRIKWIVSLLIILIFVGFGISRTTIKSVDTFKKEQAKLEQGGTEDGSILIGDAASSDAENG
ncbi:MAG: hypothetical protein K6F77_00400, partial [Lachnospiraceae bacterium]|nr:hypothetical protein [Lachnospiraceae bacterium]